jgi:regulator of nonsense transcripts 1
MDTFDNFQYDSASSYGGIGIVDDTSSVYTATTSNNLASDLESLSLSGSATSSQQGVPATSHAYSHKARARSGVIDEDIDAVLEDLKDEGQVDLPPHACR